MRRLTVLAIAVCSLALAAPPASAGLVCARTMTIEDFRYLPGTAAKIAQADLLVICWHNEDGVSHTATSNVGLFDTGHIAPGLEAGSTLYGAGTYRYHCEIHPSMAGKFNVRPAASDASITAGGTFTLTVGPSGGLVEARPGTCSGDATTGHGSSSRPGPRTRLSTSNRYGPAPSATAHGRRYSGRSPAGRRCGS